MKAEDLFGSWTLVRIESADGLPDDAGTRIKLPFGDDPQGIIHYLPDRRMAVLIQARDRPLLPGGRTGGSDAQWRQSSRGFTAYGGTYEVQPGRVIHHVEFNSFPNDIGVPYVRVARIEGDLLMLETLPDDISSGGHMQLVWQKLKQETAP